MLFIFISHQNNCPFKGMCIKHVFLVKAGHVCGDNIDLVDGQPTGSVRVSFGYMSTFEDCQRFLNFVADCFVDKPVKLDPVRLDKIRTATTACWDLNDSPIKITNGEVVDEKEKPTGTSLRGFGEREPNGHTGPYTLTNIYIYPIKSCGAQEVSFLPLTCFCLSCSHSFPLSLSLSPS